MHGPVGGPAGQERAEDVVGCQSVAEKEPTDYGWFQWVRFDQIPEFEAAGWKLSACVSRFHFDSYLMFKPVCRERTAPQSAPPPEP